MTHRNPHPGALRALQMALWTVLALCSGPAWGLRTGDALDSYLAQRVVRQKVALACDRRTYPDGTTDSTEYDAAGRKTAQIDAEGRKTSFTYDAVGQLLSVTDASGQVTNYAYDAVGNRIAQTDAKGRTTSFHYDILNRLTAKIYVDGAKDSTEYDLAGNVARHIAANGEVTTFAYDILNREVLRTYLTSGHTVATTWNVDGSRSTVLDSRGLTQYGYDARGRLSTQTNPDGAVLRWTFDTAGNIASRITPWGTTRYHTDVLGRVDSVVDSRAGVVTQAWDALGRLKATTRPNGISTGYTYTSRGMMDTLYHRKSGVDLARFSYGFDRSGLRVGATDKFGASTTPVVWNHASLTRLTKETKSGVAQSWGYDAVSNRTTQVSGGSSIAAVFDTRDRLTALGTTSFSWDVAGRLTARNAGGSTRFGWTDDDRLRHVDLASGGSVDYGYDAQGMMASRTEASAGLSPGASGTERYTWDGTLPYGQMVGVTNASGVLKSREVWGVEHLAEVRNDTVLWLLTDGLGNVRAIADSIGKVVGRQDFDAWGNRTTDSGRTVRFGYRGEWSDGATGLIYLRARWMDPMTGRFVSEDPYEGEDESPTSLHRYLYANGSPVAMTDPTGEFSSLGEAMSGLAIQATLLAMRFPTLTATIGFVGNLLIPEEVQLNMMNCGIPGISQVGMVGGFEKQGYLLIKNSWIMNALRSRASAAGSFYRALGLGFENCVVKYLLKGAERSVPVAPGVSKHTVDAAWRGFLIEIKTGSISLDQLKAIAKYSYDTQQPFVYMFMVKPSQAVMNRIAKYGGTVGYLFEKGL